MAVARQAWRASALTLRSLCPRRLSTSTVAPSTAHGYCYLPNHCRYPSDTLFFFPFGAVSVFLSSPKFPSNLGVGPPPLASRCTHSNSVKSDNHHPSRDRLSMTTASSPCRQSSS